MQTIVELPEFKRRYATLLSEDEKQGTGGIRKFRWSSGNKGKSGGVRVIYYFHNESVPLFLLTIFAKSEKANISKSDRNELAKFTDQLIKNYGASNV